MENIYVTLPGGGRIPLKEVADIEYASGPAQISRDNTRRRIVVGVNVRGRDLESVVVDARAVIESEVELPPGYTVEYGGQFENLRSARKRLMVVVPIALLLIFIMLHFAFGSIGPAILVFSAVPLSAVGGVLLLLLRGMPFSISAGVGFVALFGVSVLNGIVLIEHYGELERSGMSDLKERVIAGARQRLRPVLLTAASTAFGFFPMAFSTGAGAEVQRPLATVVVGGLVTATLLTLVVLPVLYCLMENRNKYRKKYMPKWLVLFALLFLPSVINAQKPLSPDQAVQMALENNGGIRASQLRVESAAARIGTAWDIEKTGIFVNYDENNIAHNDEPITVWGFNQNFRFPLVYVAQKKVLAANEKGEVYQHKINQRELTRSVLTAYYDVVCYGCMQNHYQILDSLYSRYVEAAQRRLEMGEIRRLDLLMAKAKKDEINLLLMRTREDKRAAHNRLSAYIQSEEEVAVALDSLSRLDLGFPELSDNPVLAYQRASGEMIRKQLNVEKLNWLPDISLGYFQGTNEFDNARVYKGFEVGLAFPLFFGSQGARVKSARLEAEAARHDYRDYEQQVSALKSELMTRLNKYEQALNVFETRGDALAKEMMDAARKSYQEGEISMFEYVSAIDQARRIIVDHMESLRQYNQTVLEMKYLTR